MSARDHDYQRDHEPTTATLLLVVIDELRAIRKALERTPTTKDALIGPREFANVLAVSERHLRRMRAAGELPTNAGKKTRPRWRRSDVEAFVAKLKAKG